MKKILLIMLALTAAALIFVMPEIFSRASSMIRGVLDSRQKHSGMTEVWYCPMHPNYTSDRPGLCPICNMSLVKKEGHPSDEHALKEHVAASLPSGYGMVKVTEHQQQLMGVKTTKVVRKPLTKTIYTSGYVAHDLELYQAQIEYINAWREYAAYQSRRPVKEEYRQGWRQYYANPSNRPRSVELRDAQQRMIKAEYELVHMGISEEQLQSLRKVKYGQPWIQPEILFFREQHPFWVYASIFESEIGFVDVGQEVNIDIPAYHEQYKGVVKVVAGAVDEDTRTVRVIIEITNLRSDLKANMLVDVGIKVELNDYVIVPRDAVMDTGTRQIVFVQTAAGQFEPRQVKVAMTGDGVYGIKEGLKEGEIVAAEGNFLLDSESKLQASFAGVGHEGH
jgi:Cu(I)/Ag(I) efflux system membrane fusion protein